MKLIQQDMLALKEGILFHQVNCEGVMGGGIAFALARKFPWLEKEYQQFCQENANGQPLSLLGKLFVCRVGERLYVANVFGQSLTSRGDRQTNYEAVAKSFEQFPSERDRLIPVSWPYYFPYKMGCGLGGGEWSIYSAMIDHYFPCATICQHNA